MSGDVAPAPVAFPAALSDEDRARAEFYAVLGRLFMGPPDGPLLAALGAAGQPHDAADLPVVFAWNRLVEASQVMNPEAAAQEYTDLFVGVGKAECNLHASYWVRDAAQRPLVAVRADLAGLGLARVAQSTLYEDHLGALCETMRILVAGAPGRAPATVDVQRRFFERHIGSWAKACCDAITQCSVANYYARVGQFATAFLAVERESFDIE
jgi:TorA maturation chaperone TorD